MYNGECNHSFFDWYLSNFPFKFLFPSFPQSGFSQMDWFIQIKVGLTWMDGTFNSLKNHPKKPPPKPGIFCLLDPPGVGSRWCSVPPQGVRARSRWDFHQSLVHPSPASGVPPPKMVNWGISTDGWLFIWKRPGCVFSRWFFFVQVDFFCFFQNEKKTLQDIGKKWESGAKREHEAECSLGYLFPLQG